jgi:PiT family inorganic phosphate transporter
MDSNTLFILLVLVLAFVFDFINGVHDAANAIATIVTTKVLTPNQAVLWAAFFNFIAFLIFNLMVARTIGNGLIDPSLIDPLLILAALIGAIFWNLVTWYFGLPSSSSHALIGGLAGAAVAKSGFSALNMTGFAKVLAGILLSPSIGLLIGLLCAHLFNRLSKHHDQHTLDKYFKRLQLLSSALLSITHGGNDAQKTMGIIAVLLFSVSWIEGPFHIPLWVVISCHAVISLGTLIGGWRIIHTMGHKITQLNRMKGCAAETGAACTIFVATQLGIPVSTTHTVTGAITGTGLIHGLNKVHWRVVQQIVLSWLLTIPAAGLVSAIIMMSQST